eukprot:Plantae.Rhodophyta-Hildenbrandia_rubra.ctg10780.p1 GENE.Plantae.Rhodophyta-Hildenbrandia_rubra.ctg10780~~Plantae.Rhodophyta-Hildenbrandia_rubra.ctg10780.p1  ORF type:complete len:850 (-),score=111.31 Plantae.Rhodophyta-Hildenbrandia_rubra.ctg10780:648-3197(-)
MLDTVELHLDARATVELLVYTQTVHRDLCTSGLSYTCTARVQGVELPSFIDFRVRFVSIWRAVSMPLVQLLSLPPDALHAIIAELPFQSAIHASRSCKKLNNCYNLCFPNLVTTLSLSHTSINDGQLLAICRRAQQSHAKMRALAVAGCPRLTANGLVEALGLVGSHLEYLDLSACHAGLVNNSTLEQIAPLLPNLYVLRLAYVTQVTGAGLSKMADKGFGNRLHTLDVSYTWTVTRTLLGLFANLKYLIAPGTKLLSTTASGQRASSVVTGLDVARTVGTMIISVDLWELVASDNRELFRFLLRIITPDGLKGVDLKSMFVASAVWNQHTSRASESTWMRIRSSKRNRRVIEEDTSLLSHTVSSSAINCAKVLVNECCARLSSNALDSWAALKHAIVTSSNLPTKTAMIETILQKGQQGRCRLAPELVKVMVLAAKRNDLIALRALLTGCFPQLENPDSTLPSPAPSKLVVCALSSILLTIIESAENVEKENVAACVEAVDLLIKAGACIGSNFKTAALGENAVHLAAKLGDFRVLERILKGFNDARAESLLLSRSDSGQTPLTVAASNECGGKVVVAAILTTMTEIEAKRGLNTQKRFDFEGAKAIVAALTNAGPNDGAASEIAQRRPTSVRCIIDKKDSNWATLCLHHVARRVGRGGTGDESLLFLGRKILQEAASAAFNHAEGYGKAMSTWVNFTTKDTIGRTSLHYAAGASDSTFAQLLLQYGAKVDAQDNDQATPLCTAVEWHASRACLEVLLRAGANVDHADIHSKTALHRAAEARNGSAAALLVRFGANPYRKDKLGLAPVDVDRALLPRARRFLVYPVQKKVEVEPEDAEDLWIARFDAL